MSNQDGDSAPGPPMDQTDRQVFYQILENTARTAEEVTHLREDLRELNKASGEMEARVSRTEAKVKKHDWVLRVVQFVVGALTLGFGGYFWTVI